MPVSQRKRDGGKIGGPANVPNVVEIAMFITLPNAKTSRMAAHGFFSGAPPNMQTIASQLWTSLSSAWSNNLGAHMHVNTSFIRVECRDMTSYLNPISIGTGTAVSGVGTGPAMPPDNAIVLTEQIASRGRGLKGRLYLGGWDTSADAGQGFIAGAVQTAVNTFGTSLFNAITTASLLPCVAQPARQQYQGLTGTIHPARVANHVLVTSYTCRDLNWDTQRRRGTP